MHDIISHQMQINMCFKLSNSENLKILMFVYKGKGIAEIVTFLYTLKYGKVK